MKTRQYRVFNCTDSRDFKLETCFLQGTFVYESSAVNRLIQCTGVRVWIEKDGVDVTEELLDRADPKTKMRLAEIRLTSDIVYGRAARGGRR